ncbi:response regulator transcription factor [Ramlibacter aquaticus]|uniref:Response regulator transcription factor n=2 Tax=Ramlibacter TaxID=174951 RepID=A0ABR9SBM4_9BURK|nr:LytTR family DNA-binding domain-containing protein [Ramlibacter aquaticus]MBE7939182.1 response regulator transcription factor [Ramlibacter aquaticus]
MREDTAEGPLRVLLGEDDRQQLAAMADAVARLRPHWQLVRASDAAQVREALAGDPPDLAILDVRMGNATSLDIVQAQPRRVPCIFVTGDPIFAVRAFDCDAVDFVLKPLRAQRLAQALAKAEALLAEPAPVVRAQERSALCMFRGTALVWSPLAEVDYFLADRKYTRVMVREGWEGLLRMGIGSVEEALDKASFLRIHRGCIVNLKRIELARRDPGGRLVLRLRGRAESLPVSRPYESDFFGEGFR